MSAGMRVAVVSGLAAVALPAVNAAAQTNPIQQGTVQVRLLPFATIPGGSGAPQDLVSANDGTGRLFVATRGGQIRTLDALGGLSPTPFLDLSAAIGSGNLFTDGEGGFSGLAFSPNFSAGAGVPGSGKFYTFTTEDYSAANAAQFSHPEIAPQGGLTPTNQIVIREWSVNPATPNVANTASRVLMRINHPDSNHQGGGLKFGSDGMLYLSLGDGGGGNDRADGGDSTSLDGHTNNLGNAQDLSVVYGKILRIDPNGTNGAGGGYGIPSDNPFVGQQGTLGEIFAYGLRNPYRFSFDRGGAHALYVGDVGQSAREEVDIVTSGGNYGWVFREGTRDNTTYRNAQNQVVAPPAGFSSIDPIGEYTHSDGFSVLGGFVYRGTAIPDLYGKYVFGDLGSRLFYMDAAGGTISEFRYDLTGGGVGVPTSSMYGLGEDAGGELYAMFVNGQVLRLIPEPGAVGVIVASAVPWVVGRRRREA